MPTSRVEEAADEVAEARRSRYPVYTESRSTRSSGVVHAKDILTALRVAPAADGARRSCARRSSCPGTREVEDVLADMKRLKTHLAVVLDEYGGTAGLVTMEDLLEEIVGPIYDEYDRQDIGRRRRRRRACSTARCRSAEFNAEYDAALDDTDYTTLGGYVFGQLGRLPRAG